MIVSFETPLLSSLNIRGSANLSIHVLSTETFALSSNKIAKIASKPPADPQRNFDENYLLERRK